MEVQLLSHDASAPTRGSTEAAGFDLYSSENTTVVSGERRLVSTGISVAIPYGYYGRVAPRSGLAVKKSIDIGAGVVDSDYRGEVKILIINNGDCPFHINKRDRIAQLVIEKIFMGDIVEVDQLSTTVRGDGGFGSTGMN